MNSSRSRGLYGAGLVTLALASGVGAWAVAYTHQPKAEDDEQVIQLAQAPEAVRTAAAKVTGASPVTKVVKEDHHGASMYEVEYTEGGAACTAVISAAGDVLELEKSVTESALPAAALAALKKKYPGATLADIVLVQRFEYEVDVTANGKKHEVEFDATGAIDDDDAEEDGKGKDEDKDD